MSPDHGFHPLRVKRIVQETHDAKSFVFDVPAEARDDFAYEAGQFCTFRVRIGDEDLLRCYSMSSSPHTDPDLTTTVKRVPGGRVSNWMLDEVAEGDVLALTRPAGVFTLRPRSAPLVAFSGGSGITPVISVIKSALTTADRSVRLLYANRNAESVIFADELDALACTYPNRVEVVHHLDVEHGFVHSDSVTQFVNTAIDADFYVCGPAAFMDVVEDALAVLHVSPDRVFIERFANAAAARRDEPPATLPGDDAGTESVVIVLDGTTHSVQYRAGETILETARRAGLRAPFSCEAGSCATCMARVVDGEVTMRLNNALTPEEVAEGWVLTCQGFPASSAVTVVYEP
ncbi:MAG: ferredoxin--NADP reductase [Acidimicrobiia bacterium]